MTDRRHELVAPKPKAKWIVDTSSTPPARRWPPLPARRSWWPASQAAQAAPQPGGGTSPDLIVINADGLHDGPAGAARRGLRGVGRTLRRRRFDQRHPEPGRQEHADVRCQGHDRGAGLHRLPQPRDRGSAAERGAGRQSLRGGVRQHPQHHRQAAREGADGAGRHVGRGLLLRRHQGQRQARADHSRSGRGVVRASGDRPPPRRPHLLLQQQGVRHGGHHQGHAEPAGRDLRQGCERQADRPRHRRGVGAVQQGRHAPDLHAGGGRSSAPATAWRTSRSSSRATA